MTLRENIKNQSNKQQGFAHVEIILLLIVFAIVGVVGFTVFKRSGGFSNISSEAESGGCPVAVQTSQKTEEYYRKNKATFMKDYGSKYLWAWKLMAYPENAPYAKNAADWDRADMSTLNRTESNMFRRSTFKFDCAIEKKCGAEARADWDNQNKVRWCVGKERVKAQPASVNSMKTVGDDKKGMRVKACRVSNDPNQQIRFGIFDTYAEAKRLVENYEKKKGIKFQAAPMPDGFTAERWKKMTVYDKGGTDKERAIAEVQKRLYDVTYKTDGSAWYDTLPTHAYLKLNKGLKRKYYGGKTNSASLQQVRTAESVVWMGGTYLRTPLEGASETIFHYNKIEGYHKSANKGEKNPIVHFSVTYWQAIPNISRTTDWMGTHAVITDGSNSTKKVFGAETRFNKLAKCSNTMYPTSLYELAKKEGWE